MSEQTGRIRWGYAINQWDTNIDSFVRDEAHERAFKTISICGFQGVEFTALNFGPWEPFGNPGAIGLRYGSPAALRSILERCGVAAVSSWVLDPAIGFDQDPGPGVDVLDPAARSRVLELVRWFAPTLQELGGTILAVRAVGSAWRTGALSDEQITVLADLWNAAGQAVQEHGVRLAVHFDFLSALRLGEGLERLLAATDPQLVGLALDTAEFFIAGRDPLSVYRAHADRVWHLHLKGARETVDDDEARVAHADQEVRTAGGTREIGRWFFEPSDTGPIDFAALTSELVAGGYEGWVIVETDGSPHPAKSAMLSGWYVKQVLGPLVASR